MEYLEGTLPTLKIVIDRLQNGEQPFVEICFQNEHQSDYGFDLDKGCIAKVTDCRVVKGKSGSTNRLTLDATKHKIINSHRLLAAHIDPKTDVAKKVFEVVPDWWEKEAPNIKLSLHPNEQMFRLYPSSQTEV